MLRLLNPLSVLKRGYSITTVDGKTINGAMRLKAGFIIHTKTFDLEIESEIKNIEEYGE